MTSLSKCISSAAVMSCLVVAAIHAAFSQPSARTSSDKAGKDRIAFSYSLPDLDGRHLKVTLVEVTYGPGEYSEPHSHPCPVSVYVLEGALRAQVKGEQEAIYKAGQSFYEAPNGVHQVSANASQKDPAKFLAYFVCDRDVPLSLAPPIPQPTGGKKP